MINDRLMAEIQHRVDAVRDRRWETVRYEIQDSGLFLLVNVQVALSQSDRQHLDEIGRVLGSICQEMIPRRPDFYAWMIAIELDGKMVESFMGGAVGMPDRLPIAP